jgi:hypothetical protein
MKDYHWGSLLHYIKEKGNCKGCTFPNYEFNETTKTFDINDKSYIEMSLHLLKFNDS